MSLRVIELFAGGGGSALGLQAAGMKHIACVEFSERDDDSRGARESSVGTAGHLTLLSNGFPSVWYDARKDPFAANPGPSDALWASPPCQPWSNALERERLGADDPRNLWPAVFSWIEAIEPRWVMIENVVGMVMHQGRFHPDPRRCPGCYWRHIILPFFEGHFASVQWKVLDAADYGLPQRRHRVFLVAGPTPIQWPQKTHSRTPEGHERPWQDAGAVLVSLVDYSQDRARERAIAIWKDPSPCVTATEHRGARATVWLEGTTPRRASDGLFRATAVPWHEKATSPGPAPGQIIGSLRRKDGSREPVIGYWRLTIPEVALLQGFPPDYTFSGGVREQYLQIGNAVPPIMARLLGKAVLRADEETSR